MKTGMDCDVLVCGAGPAGSTISWILARKGFRVILVDKKEFPRQKLCGGLLTWKTVSILERIFGFSPIDLRAKHIFHYQSRRYALFNRRQRLFTGMVDDPFYFVDRKTFDDFLVHQAEDAGAVVRLAEGVKNIDIHRPEVTTDRGNSIRPAILVAADGAGSRVRRMLAKTGCVTDTGSTGVAFSIEGFCSRQDVHFPDYPCLYFGFLPWGYAWSFPGPTEQVIGLGGLLSKNNPGFNSHFAPIERYLSNYQKLPKREAPQKKNCKKPVDPGQSRFHLIYASCMRLFK